MENENIKTFELANGENIELSLTFAKLYRLRACSPQEYEKYNKVIMDGAKDTFDFLRIIYTAYLCHNIESIDECMSFDDFIKIAPFDINNVITVAMSITTSKKN